MSNEISLFNILGISSLFFFITIFLLNVLSKKYSFIFGISISNIKTSKYHPPMPRGLGIVFPIILIFSALILGSFFNAFETIIITMSTLLGFGDDKYSLNYKTKLIIIILIGSIFSYYTVETNEVNNFYFLKFILNLFVFIFLILFFNQIDGINCMASGNILIVFGFLFLNGLNLVLLLPIIFSIVAYMFVNMKGNICIQGDAGSYFMGSLICLLLTRSFDYIEFGFIFIILGPILFDISSTTLVRFFYGINLSIGHRNNLYQKLVSKLDNHVLVTIKFCIVQILFCIILFWGKQKFSLDQVYTWMLLVVVSLSLVFCYSSYLIHNKKFLN